MKKIAFVFIAAMAVLSLGGCKKKGGAGEAISKMETFKKDMCACADKACADKVSKAMDDWSKAQDKGDKDKAAKMSPEDEKKMTAIAEEMGKCMMKHMGAPAPADPGSAAAPPADPAGSAAAPAPAPEGSAAAPAPEGSAAAPAGSAK